MSFRRRLHIDWLVVYVENHHSNRRDWNNFRTRGKTCRTMGSRIGRLLAANSHPGSADKGRVKGSDLHRWRGKKTFGRDATARSRACGRGIHDEIHHRRDHTRRRFMTEFIEEVEDGNFEQVVLQSERPVLADDAHMDAA